MTAQSKTFGAKPTYGEEEKSGSDLNVLVEFSRTIGLLGFVGLRNDLSDLFGIKVDLVMKRALRRRIGRRILEEVVQV